MARLENPRRLAYRPHARAIVICSLGCVPRVEMRTEDHHLARISTGKVRNNVALLNGLGAERVVHIETDSNGSLSKQPTEEKGVLVRDGKNRKRAPGIE